MALTSVKNLLQMASINNTAIIGLNCTDYNSIYAGITAAEETKTPIICMLYPDHARVNNYITLRGFASLVTELAEKKTVPIGLHLDHCSEIDYIEQAISDGFKSVMYDGSSLPYEENVKNTCIVKKMCEKSNIDLEAELGYVGVTAIEDELNADFYTEPDMAADFVKRTNVDCLAVAIGTAHGVYKSTPRLDIERLAAIKEAVKIPLVLHGGSGVPEKQLTESFRKGIRKLNVGTEYYQVWRDSMAKNTVDSKVDILDIVGNVQNDLKVYLHNKLKLTEIGINK